MGLRKWWQGQLGKVPGGPGGSWSQLGALQGVGVVPSRSLGHWRVSCCLGVPGHSPAHEPSWAPHGLATKSEMLGVGSRSEHSQPSRWPQTTRLPPLQIQAHAPAVLFAKHAPFSAPHLTVCVCLYSPLLPPSLPSGSVLKS